jgi:curli biogenesis system outer membrane secretion channel CsgG
MKTLRHFLVFLALTFTAIAHAVTEDVTVSTTGYGDSYQKAVATALLEAVSQVRGVNIATDKTLKSDFEAYATDNAAYAKSQTQVVQDISVQTKGQVKSYQITSTKEPSAEGGQWEVQAQVVVPSYKAMGKEDKRFSIAVMPFHSKSGKSVVAGKLRDDILNTLTQSRKFNVVSRDFENEFAAEKDLLQSDDVSANEASRLGQVSGADLMVVGTIYDASVSTKTTVTPTETTNFYGMSVTEGGQVHTSSKSSVKLNYRVIEVATQKVKWANPSVASEIAADNPPNPAPITATFLLLST